MNEEAYWSLFVQTGSPDAYLLYRGAMRHAQSLPQPSAPA